MFGKTRISVSFMLGGVLFFLVASGFLIIAHIRSLAGVIVNDNLLGLSYAGRARSGQADAFVRTMLFLDSSDPAERAKLKKEIEAITDNNSDALRHYKSSIYSGEDRQLYENVRLARDEYLRTRQNIFAAAPAHQRTADISASEFRQAHDAYGAALDRLFQYNRNVGRLRGHRILTACSAAQWGLAALTVGVFAIGFKLGLQPVTPKP